MQGKRPLPISDYQLLKQYRPTEHILLKLESLIDFSFIRKLTDSLCCDNLGRPSIDLEIFFRM